MARRGRIERRFELNNPAEPTARRPAPPAAPSAAEAATPSVDAARAADSVPVAGGGGSSAALPLAGTPAARTPPAAPAQASHVADSYTLLEVAQHLQVSPETLRAWRRRFARFLSAAPAESEDPLEPAAEWPTFSQADVAVLVTIQTLLQAGSSDAQVSESLQPKRIEPARLAPEAGAQVPARTNAGMVEQGGTALTAGMGQAIGDVLGAIAGSQQAVLNSQASMREMVSVVVQDNFNLKDENRKLRERMLELERALAEYQRREETRKERMEARMRALEGTMAALQQQMTQFVQLQRAQQKKRGIW